MDSKLRVLLDGPPAPPSPVPEVSETEEREDSRAQSLSVSDAGCWYLVYKFC